MANWTVDDRFDPVPAPLCDVLDLVLPDFQQPSVVGVVLGYESSTGVLWVSEPGQEARSGFGPVEAHDRSWLVVQVADWLQDQFFMESVGAWGESRPACPGHHHPAQGHGARQRSGMDLSRRRPPHRADRTASTALTLNGPRSSVAT
ncbi:MAG TPA: hypothetical protein VI318_00035 [Baekduia sp.]